MRMDMVVRCICGHRIGLNELLSHGFVVVGNEPAHVYLKYRCSVCDHEGLELLEYERWNSMLKDPQSHGDEATDMQHLGPIGASELLYFAQSLANLTERELAALQR